MSDSRDLGIALSGGGHRATVFSLGALLAVTDAGLNERTVSISSVSGGSIANGVMLNGPDFGTAASDQLERHIGAAVRAVAHRGVLLGGAPATKGYLLMLKVAAAVAFIGLVATLVFGFLQYWIGLAAGLIVLVVGGAAVWRLFGQRSVRTEKAIDDEMLGGVERTMSTLGEGSVHHVICTTELQTGTEFFFSNRMVYGHQFGGKLGGPSIRLATAVQASACVPGAFKARTIPLADLGLPSVPATLARKKKPPKQVSVARIVIDDGGVYDNMADEWEYGFDNRRRRGWPQVVDAQSAAAKMLLVVNGSGGWNRLKPIVSKGPKFELDGLLRAKDVQYDVSTSHRRRALGELFRDADGESDDVAGAFAQITSNPYAIPTSFAPRPGFQPDAKARRAVEAKEFLDNYGLSESDWDAIVSETSGVGTKLEPLGAAICAKLLEHAYVLTTINLYVVLGLGTLDRTIDRQRFTALCQPVGTAGTSGNKNV
jgi:predicted acylesterase/phospholipase RssA